ncbi:alcohol dehydrogenase catalytic domain-containing protein [Streptomyces sp. NPDC058157]|uniref:alcohol dehydrogenase catalytic domain-containing protein n=1 Tax=Streptomyces sp. NPDC058157 TaxID=3346360 RepID=UPI0036E7AFEF
MGGPPCVRPVRKVRIGKVDFFGPPPFVLGHEYSGMVEAVGEGVTRFATTCAGSAPTS